MIVVNGQIAVAAAEDGGLGTVGNGRNESIISKSSGSGFIGVGRAVEGNGSGALKGLGAGNGGKTIDS